MYLNLSPEDRAEYERRCAVNQAAKEAATRIGDVAAAKRARQANTRLYQEYERKQIPDEDSFVLEKELRMTLEQRIIRIEQHLKLGVYSE